MIGMFLTILIVIVLIGLLYWATDTFITEPRANTLAKILLFILVLLALLDLATGAHYVRFPGR